ncbi:hypothetical protein ACQY0O_008310 [Thecaphora frezii]
MQTKTYALTFLILLLATVLNSWSVWTPNWIRTSTPSSSPIHYSARYGLTQRCERAYLDLPAVAVAAAANGWDKEERWKCRSFPLAERDCGDDRTFCAAWRGASYAAQMSFAFLIVALLGLVLILALNGRQRKQNGWKIVSGCSAIAVALQAVAVGAVADRFNNDDRFYAGSKLGSAFVVATASLSLVTVTIVGLVIAGIQSQRQRNGPMGDGYLPVA